jgi:nuclear transport factor 2 (NTF2) superfamily protein
MATETSARPPFPPFTRESAIQKVRLAEDGWNTRDPQRVALAYTIDSRWRNRSEFMNGRNEIIDFLSRKWARELDYRLIKEMWAFTGNRIAVRFAYEWHDESDHWYRSYGNENWEFNNEGLMVSRFASINDLPILASDRKYHWALGRRPDDHPGLRSHSCDIWKSREIGIVAAVYVRSLSVASRSPCLPPAIHPGLRQALSGRTRGRSRLRDRR